MLKYCAVCLNILSIQVGKNMVDQTEVFEKTIHKQKFNLLKLKERLIKFEQKLASMLTLYQVIQVFIGFLIIFIVIYLTINAM